jgi:uncharacterized sulfatase
MTTRGIINGSDSFGIRSVRSDRFKLIVNLTPGIKFTNACTKSSTFQSWVRKAESGDTDAAEKVRRYHHRPAVELYDVKKDWYEWKNLADNPEYAEVKAALQAKLAAWMEQQGDLGQATELAAREHQGRSRNKKAATKKETKR